mmetsp:Transcript_7981/g.21905  ORF Transcript_7981/g.21905 Transcript_7981/m.21905 type:complete len:241 (-) Transcript_7981:873-1595(-)
MSRRVSELQPLRPALRRCTARGPMLLAARRRVVSSRQGICRAVAKADASSASMPQRTSSRVARRARSALIPSVLRMRAMARHRNRPLGASLRLEPEASVARMSVSRRKRTAGPAPTGVGGEKTAGPRPGEVGGSTWPAASCALCFLPASEKPPPLSSSAAARGEAPWTPSRRRSVRDCGMLRKSSFTATGSMAAPLRPSTSHTAVSLRRWAMISHPRRARNPASSARVRVARRKDPRRVA